MERKDKVMTNFNRHKLGGPPQISLSKFFTTQALEKLNFQHR